MLQRYFKSLYEDAIGRAYSIAHSHIIESISANARILDCGASSGGIYEHISTLKELKSEQYYGIEWSHELVQEAQSKGFNIQQADLNKALPFEDDYFTCIYGLSLLEHLLNPCRYLKECYRTLKPNGKLVILTPNISTYFTAVLILSGKMPSSGPHPDSDMLVKSEQLFKVSNEDLQPDTESDTPVHRHLIVFSYRTLKQYLEMIGFVDIQGYGFGLYPFPIFMQPLLERIDPYHCHQMVFTAVKPE